MKAYQFSETHLELHCIARAPFRPSSRFTRPPMSTSGFRFSPLDTRVTQS